MSEPEQYRVGGHLTRLRKRIANGVCPCCTRSFQNVRQHIEGQHPGWAVEHAEVLGGREVKAS